MIYETVFLSPPVSLGYEKQFCIIVHCSKYQMLFIIKCAVINVCY